MAALLIGMSVAAVLMTAVMPVWKQMAQREKEAELVFRGEQYARAIGLYQKRSGPGVLPPNLDVLVEGRFLRKKFTDPVTGEDFDLLSPAQAAGGTSPTAAAGRGGQVQGRGTPPGSGTVAGVAPGGRGAVGGIVGVASKSKEASLRVYNGRTHYNEWQFVYIAQAPAPNAQGQPGGRGGAGGTPQRGNQPPGGGFGQPNGPSPAGGGFPPQRNAPPFGGGPPVARPPR